MTSRSKGETPRQRWERQMLSITILRDNLGKDHMGQGAKWVESMRAYYDRRLSDLRAVEPTEDTDV